MSSPDVPARVPYAVGDLVGHLVRMALGHRFRGEGVTAVHEVLLLSRTASSTAWATARLSRNATGVFAVGETMTTELVSCSKPAPGADTSFATTRSAPFRWSLAWALTTTSSVSAA